MDELEKGGVQGCSVTPSGNPLFQLRFRYSKSGTVVHSHV